MEIKCPCCKAKLTLEHIVLNQVRSDLFGAIFSQPKSLQIAIMGYLGLFRGQRDLTDDKALRIVQEVFALPYLSQDILVAALLETTDAIRAKGQDEPLKNHNYLKSVMRSVEARGAQVQRIQTAPAIQQRQAPQANSKAAAALTALDNLRGEYGEE